ncbi:MAG: DUF3368 domain-containing protein [Dolichospermum sp. DET50]|nr:DUF3368 domain-containing protein [Dolichospermum sp. DET66]MBS3033417.1 DUF3368 domain-containing protein [Dolichospermum sp. DET67]MBS3038621.1 DUF3368 domain-containing protein [Dolichospermum sp. DET50]QSX65903.1 MAG: DUF3368 domain-containing protein [Dolichospermum sp. DET69]
MIVVSNTTPFSELAKVGRMNLLGDIFGKVIIPQEVYDEITTGTHPAVNAVKSANWIEVLSIRNSQQVSILQSETNLDLGECAAIILAEELGADRVLIDEWAARKVAKSRHLPVTGTVGILLIAKHQGLIESVKPVLDELMAQGKRISQQLYQEVLDMAKE